MRTVSRLVLASLLAGCSDATSATSEDVGAGDAVVADAFAPDTSIADAPVADTLPGLDSTPPTDAGSDVPAPCEPLPSTIPVGTAGATSDTVATAKRRLVLMGGGAEVDEASRLFVQAANGGDVLVLRATGSVDSYTGYFGKVGASPGAASITTLLLADAASSSPPAVACRVDRAEALFLAGGDQWSYLGVWNTGLQARCQALATRGTVGGTSAGSMVYGAFAFTAEKGGLTSATALAEPRGPAVTVSKSLYAQPELAHALVDTHFSQRDREGRLLVFAAHMLAAGESTALAIGIDENTALVIDGPSARVLGSGAVHVYTVAGPLTTFSVGSPLGLGGIRHQVLATGSTTAWPPPAGGVSLEVASGKVRTL